MFSIRQVWGDLKLSSSHIIVAVLLFVVSGYIGATNTSFQQFLDLQLSSMGELVKSIDESSNPRLLMFVVIFLNNAIKSVFVIFAGAFFGVFPIFFLVLNGLILGYVIQLASVGMAQMTVWEMIFKTLLPHGILEIPALIIAGAYGLRLGRLLFSLLGALLFNHNKIDAVGSNYKETLKRCGVMAIYITIVLFVAAIIESTLTMWLATI